MRPDKVGRHRGAEEEERLEHGLPIGAHAEGSRGCAGPAPSQDRQAPLRDLTAGGRSRSEVAHRRAWFTIRLGAAQVTARLVGNLIAKVAV